MYVLWESFAYLEEQISMVRIFISVSLLLFALAACAPDSAEPGAVPADTTEGSDPPTVPAGAAASDAQFAVTNDMLETFEVTLTDAMDAFPVPGMAVAIVQNDTLVYAQGFGLRNRASATPVTPETLFRVGSDTKPMTALLLATLVDDGQLEWDQPVSAIWPDLDMPTATLTEEARVRDLLSMRTGLGADPMLALYAGDRTPADTLELLATLPVVAEPGEAYHYNNQVYAATGYIGALAASAEMGELQDAYRTLMQERVFTSIGMESATLENDLALVSSNYAVPYAPHLLEGVVVANMRDIGGDLPAGGVAASVTDMAQFLLTMLNEGVAPDGTRVVSATTLAELWEPQISIPGAGAEHPLIATASYGMGWAVYELANGVRMIGHNGAIDGYSAMMAFIPEADVGIVALNNASIDFGGDLNGLARDLLVSLLYDMEPAVIERYTSALAAEQEQYGRLADQVAPVDPDAVAPYVGQYEQGWRIELRAPEGDAATEPTLWLTRDVRAWQLMALPTDYIVIGGPLFTLPVSFSEEEGSIQMLLGVTPEGPPLAALAKVE
jgi:CubicO group peptidase (beta-lactamase class C family)